MHRFEELKCIGRGSYGSAHLVRERAGLQSRYVVKKIPMELLSAKEKDQSFREVELLAKLKHPNVVEYKENFVLDNVLHIVMAYCDGGDLAGKIKEQQKTREQVVGPDCNPSDPRGYFSISQVLDWFVQMAMAIKYLHGQRVLHRDLKTSNVFLTMENVVKLGDFGIAKTLDSTLDQAKTVVGTPYYMSPEVCESKPYSYASDVWSLGCVLYEMLALRHAFDAPNILTLILKIVQQDFAPVPPHYDKEVSNLLRMLLDKDPARRPSMEEIFAMPFIRHHMQGLMASGGSLKVKVINPIARRPQHGSASAVGRRRLHPKNVSARRSSGEKRKLRLSTPTSSQAAPVAPMQWMPIKSFNEDEDDADVRNELELLDASILEESQLSFRLPERSTTPEPLVLATEKPHPSHNRERGMHTEEIHEELSNTMTSPIRPQPRLASRDSKPLAWGQREHNDKVLKNGGTCSTIKYDDDDDDDSRFHAEAEELMNPNFQSEYSEECIDSLQIYYGSKEAKDSSNPTIRALDADSADDGESADTSSSEYEAEENFYSDDSSDFFDQSGTQYSDDFEDPDAEIIEYEDDEFVSEDEQGTEVPTSLNREDEEGATDLDNFHSLPPFAPYRPAGDDNGRFARVPKLEA
ncbi:NEK protein kinase [Phytophthora cinnamomi]|uniref:NEK protein kinase n=1 Tax=Phytophthora cinnamomi TaxID=4785 RepID=UPI003559804E|nr:NEK protein kinase [Phytophthora cinnamomi]